MGKQFYRQKVGIPQGSIVSTVLCNIFYADLEGKKLPFLTDCDGLLLRLIDDFLFISMNRDHAIEFLQHMQDGSWNLQFSDQRPSRVWMFCQYGEKFDKL
jgi:telomerase reverse transcriptase